MVGCLLKLNKTGKGESLRASPSPKENSGNLTEVRLRRKSLTNIKIQADPFGCLLIECKTIG